MYLLGSMDTGIILAVAKLQGSFWVTVGIFLEKGNTPGVDHHGISIALHGGQLHRRGGRD